MIFVCCTESKKQQNIEDIYFFEVNTKFISSNVLKISVISQVRSTSEIADIFNTRDEIFLVFIEKKVNFLFIFFCLGEKLNFFHSHSPLILLGVSGFSGYNTGCKHSLHLETGL